jgi:hypothetical protein
MSMSASARAMMIRRLSPWGEDPAALAETTAADITDPEAAEALCDDLRARKDAWCRAGGHQTFEGAPIRDLRIDSDHHRYPTILGRPDGGYVVTAAARARAARSGAASHTITPGEVDTVVVYRRGFSKHARQSPPSASGTAVLWSYADEHGAEHVAVLRRGGTAVIDGKQYAVGADGVLRQTSSCPA